MPVESRATCDDTVAARINALDLTEPYFLQGEQWKSDFALLRKEDPVHYQAESRHGPFWSVLTHELIPQIEMNQDVFTAAEGIGIVDDAYRGFVAMDGSKHKEQRRVMTPAFEPSHLREMAASIRQRTSDLLDQLPVGEELDWADRVSTELTCQMLARLVDFQPWEDRRRLTNWTNWIVRSSEVIDPPEAALSPENVARRVEVMTEVGNYFTEAMLAKKGRSVEADLISRMANSDVMADLPWSERVGNLTLLIVGGNDTTRHSMSAMVLAFHTWPNEWEKLKANPALIDNAVSEVVRWQTPVAVLRRTCTRDTEFAGRHIRKGDKVLMWYASANRDEAVFPDGDRFIADRANARSHLAFGFGPHRCLGARLAELQIKILLEEMLKRDMRVEVTGEPERIVRWASRGIKKLPVRVRRGSA